MCDIEEWCRVEKYEDGLSADLFVFFTICDLLLEFLQKMSIKGVKLWLHNTLTPKDESLRKKIAVWMTAGFSLATLEETNSFQFSFGPQIFPRLDQPDTRVVVCVSPWIGLVPCVGVVFTRARVYLGTSQWYYHFLHFNFKLFQTRETWILADTWIPGHAHVPQHGERQPRPGSCHVSILGSHQQ